MKFILALDQGTTSSRAVIFNREGGILAQAQHEFRQIFPQPGWVEHDPMEIWLTQLAAAREALALAGLAAHEIAALGITNQRETTLLWERHSGRPVHHAIVWQDRRTSALCESLKTRGVERVFRERTGLPLDPYFSGTKLAWLLQEVPGAGARAAAGELVFGTVDTWLLWRLTGGRIHATDVSNASRTLMFDIHRQQWDEELLQLLNVPRAVLPEIKPSGCEFGRTESSLFGEAIPICAMAGDQQAALFGQACHDEGMAKNTYGTGCFMLMQTGAHAFPSHHGLLTTVAAQLSAKPAYALEGSVFIAGALIQWLRDGLGMIEHAADVEALAQQVQDNGGVYLVPAFAGLGSPDWDPYARGAMFGLTRGVTKAHIARAALEAIAFQSAELLAAMQKDACMPIRELRVDGGAAANNLLMQFQADLLGIPVVRSKVIETTALGAAFLAGLTAGVWSNQQEIVAQWQVDRIFEPTLSRDEAVVRMSAWRKAVERTKGWAL